MQTVLIVDDDDLMSAMLARHLPPTAATHRPGVVCRACARACAGVPPAFAVVDVEMPGVDGWTFIDRVRADEMVEDLQIVIVSGSTELLTLIVPTAPECCSSTRVIGVCGAVSRTPSRCWIWSDESCSAERVAQETEATRRRNSFTVNGLPSQ